MTMTEAELIASLEAWGLDDVWTISRPGQVGIQYRQHEQLRRHTVELPAGSPREDIFPALAEWAMGQVDLPGAIPHGDHSAP